MNFSMSVIAPEQMSADMFLPDLSNLRINSVIDELPLHEAVYSLQTTGLVIAERFKHSLDLPGVVIEANGKVQAIISRRKFFENLGKPFGIEIYLKRPIEIMLDKIGPLPLILSSQMEISEAARLALTRSNHEMFEPVGVRSCNGNIHLLDVQVLYLAQSMVLSLTNELVQKQRKRAEILHSAVVKLNSVINVDEVVRSILNYAQQMCKFEVGLVYVLEKDELRVVGQVGGENLPGESLIGKKYSAREALFQKLCHTLKPLVLSKTELRVFDKHGIFWGKECERIVMLPLVSTGEVIGMLTLQSIHPDAFQEDEVELVKTFSHQAASTLLNALMFETEKIRSMELSTLNQATSSLLVTLEPSELLYKILLSAVNILTNSQRGILFVYDTNMNKYYVGSNYHFDDRRLGDYLYEFEEAWVEKAIQKRQVMVIDTEYNQDIDLPAGLIGKHRYFITLPLVDDVGILGALCLLSHSEKPIDKEIQLLEVFCSSAKAALRNSRLHAEMQQMATTDPLTGLLNRRGFYRAAIREVERAQRYEKPLSIIMADIDHFKKVNDMYGHDVGDKVICEVAKLCKNLLRSSDISCRFGGEEYVILLPETNMNDARQVAERLRNDVYQLAITARQSILSVTISLGVAQLDNTVSDPSRGLEIILNHADYALYSSKTGGRNMVSVWSGIDTNTESVSSFLGDIVEFSELAEVLQKRESELKWMEAARQATQEQLASILQNAAEAIISVNASYHILLFNCGAEKIFGFNSDEIIGKPLDLILPDHQQCLSLCTNLDVENQSHPLSMRNHLIGRRKDGFEFPVEASHSAFGLNGQKIYTIILSDITERKIAEEQVIRTNLELSQAYDQTIEGWAHALELRDLETHGHSTRVVNMVLAMAESFGMPESERVHLRRGALLHDIGKISIPDQILLKEGPLTEAEWIIMKRHPSIAYELLSPIAFLRPALDIPRFHHEHWDGSGYPLGLRGNEIPLAARIFTIVDVYDALRSDRPYRKAWSEQRGLEYINEQAGKLFDPEIVKLFLKCRSIESIAL